MPTSRLARASTAARVGGVKCPSSRRKVDASLPTNEVIYEDKSMSAIRNRIIRISFLLFVITPILAWFMVKPVRIVAPGLVGIKCYEDGVCLDSGSLEEAKVLRHEAIDFLSKKVGVFEKAPRVIFCSSWECAGKFGLGKRSAVTVGTFGSAISPRAWKSYYIRHELIHQMQAQEMGLLKCLILPSWLIEGMAYALSEDPREPLSEPWQGYRSKFINWSKSIGGSGIWSSAAQAW